MSSNSKPGKGDKEKDSYSSGDERKEKDKLRDSSQSSTDKDSNGRDQLKEQKRREKIQKIIEKEAWPARHTQKLPFKKRAALIHHEDPIMMFNVVKTNAYGKRQKRYVSLFFGVCAHARHARLTPRIFLLRTLALSASGVSNLKSNTCQWFVKAKDVFSYVSKTSSFWRSITIL